MRHHMPNVDSPTPVIDDCRESVLVAAHIENGICPDRIGMWIRPFHVHDRGPARPSRDQGSPGFFVTIGKLTQNLSADGVQVLCA